MAKGVTQISAQMHDLLRNYNYEVIKAVDEAGQEAAELCRDQLRNTSPKKTGDYAKGWTIKREGHRRSGVTDFIVHNKWSYQLTHLLENGHVIRNGKGEYGRTHPIKHIEPASEAGIQRFDLSLRTKIRGIK